MLWFPLARLFGWKLGFRRILDSLQGNLTMFMCLAITLPKANRFGRNLEHSEYIVGGWPWQILGAIRAVATVWEAGEILFFFVHRITHDFTDFLSDTFYNIWTQQRQPVSRQKLSEQNFEYFHVSGRFSKKNAKISHKISMSCDFRLHHRLLWRHIITTLCRTIENQTFNNNGKIAMSRLSKLSFHCAAVCA